MNYQTAQAFNFDESAHLPALGGRNGGPASQLTANENILSSTKLERETPLKQGKFVGSSPDLPQSTSRTHLTKISARASRAYGAKASPSKSPNFTQNSDHKTINKVKKIGKKHHFKKRDISP